jgi:hypothetical protein
MHDNVETMTREQLEAEVPGPARRDSRTPEPATSSAGTTRRSGACCRTHPTRLGERRMPGSVAPDRYTTNRGSAGFRCISRSYTDPVTRGTSLG